MPTSIPNLGRKVRSALVWEGSAQIIGQAFAWAATVIVIRLLDPSAYGIMAMATVFVSFLIMLSDLGIGAAVIQAPELNADDYQYIQGLIIVFTGTGCVLTFFGAPSVAAFFEEQSLVQILRVLSINFLLIALYQLHEALLMRELRFAQRAKVNLFSLVVSAFTSISCAVLGFGVWALVAGSAAIYVTKAIGFTFVSGGPAIPRFSFSRGRPFIAFGSIIAIDRILWFLYSNIDLAIAGKVLGKDSLGLYSVAITLSAIPLDKVVPILANVSFSAFARIQNEPERFERNVLRSMRCAALAFVPVFWGMALVAPEGVLLLLGEKWIGAVVPFQLICAVLPLRAAAALLPPALFGVGRPGVNAVNMAFSLVVMLAAFLVGVQWGIMGLATAWLVAYPCVFVVISTRAFRVLHISYRRFLANVRAALMAGLAMVFSVGGAQLAFGQEALPVVKLFSAIVIGTFTYVPVACFLDRHLAGEIRGFLGR